MVLFPVVMVTKGDRIFSQKELCLPLTILDEGQANNPNVTSNGYKMKFWGLLVMVAHMANTTQQNHKDNTTNHNVPSQR